MVPKRLDKRLEEVAKPVAGGNCRLQTPSKPALAVRGTVPGHRPGVLEGRRPPPPFQCILNQHPQRVCRAPLTTKPGVIYPDFSKGLEAVAQGPEASRCVPIIPEGWWMLPVILGGLRGGGGGLCIPMRRPCTARRQRPNSTVTTLNTTHHRGSYVHRAKTADVDSHPAF